MPKRPDAGRVRAAVAAGDPPESADHHDDDDWHDAQDKWLAKWSVRVLLDGPLRRRQWDDHVREHKRLVAAAAKRSAAAKQPKRKYARKPAVPIAREPVLAGPPRRKRPRPLSQPSFCTVCKQIRSDEPGLSHVEARAVHVHADVCAHMPAVRVRLHMSKQVVRVHNVMLSCAVGVARRVMTDGPPCRAGRENEIMLMH